MNIAKVTHVRSGEFSITRWFKFLNFAVLTGSGILLSTTISELGKFDALEKVVLSSNLTLHSIPVPQSTL